MKPQLLNIGKCVASLSLSSLFLSLWFSLSQEPLLFEFGRRFFCHLGSVRICVWLRGGCRQRGDSGSSLERYKFMNDMAGDHCGHIKASPSSVSALVPPKSWVTWGAECGLCGSVLGSHGKGYYTTATSLSPPPSSLGPDMIPGPDVPCRPASVPWSDKIISGWFL